MRSYYSSKKNESLRLCVNYRNLNDVIIKNKYSLSLIDENLNRLNRIKIYTQLNFIVVYHRMRIKKNDEWKIVFKIRYDLFEYQILFFELINASTFFQIYINRILTKCYVNITNYDCIAVSVAADLSTIFRLCYDIEAEACHCI